MGSYYRIVNPGKRQYIDPFDFGENIKWRGLITGWQGQSIHAMAIAWLTCRSESGNSVVSGDEIGGTWCGDLIYLASDSAPPDLNGIQTSTPEDPDRNLYVMAEEFEDISPRIIQALCVKDEEIAAILVGRTKIARLDETPCFLLQLLIRLARGEDGWVFEQALEKRFGEDWETAFEECEQ